ncbi:hypothetical protein FIBSPDRAFT_136187 [Athelia psychrophila]|uniref:Uncharacterized protein n=1 Tax=Athelia psychrophila TaxID=1759441 RepID=A0A166C3U4_9AGAM|nr:hypothetical protein FIBSPDRAFT_136187 [Fibularhizoctonia sp. CBS 109695]
MTQVFSIVDSDPTYCVATTTSTSSAPSTSSTSSGSGSGSVSSGDLSVRLISIRLLICLLNPVSYGRVVLSLRILQSSSPSHIGAIVGGTIGGVLALLLLGGAAWWVLKSRRERKQQTMEFGIKMGQRMKGAQGAVGPADAKVKVDGV